MKSMQTAALREHFESVCSEPPRSRNRDWMIKKIAWRLQANEQSGLPEPVRQRALARADDADSRIRPTQTFAEQIEFACDQTTISDPGRDPRLPMPGDELRKTYSRCEQLHSGRERSSTLKTEIEPLADSTVAAARSVSIAVREINSPTV